MATFLTTKGTAAEIERIINNAKEYLYLLSAFIRLTDSLLEVLKYAGKKGVPISMVYGKKPLSPDVFEQIRQITNVKLLFQRNLHAKCYLNEKTMVITSLNLLDFSEMNNKEMGVLIDRELDRDCYQSARAEVTRIIRSAKTVPLDRSR